MTVSRLKNYKFKKLSSFAIYNCMNGASLVPKPTQHQ
jgi:hypothetical protein